MMRIAKKALESLASLLLLAVLPGCASLKQALTKAVIIEYDQVNNFEDYKFLQTFVVQEKFNQYSVETIHAGHESESGLWMVFLICKINNNASEAEPFLYDVSKFYVEFGGKNYYAASLEPYTFTYTP